MKGRLGHNPRHLISRAPQTEWQLQIHSLEAKEGHSNTQASHVCPEPHNCVFRDSKTSQLSSEAGKICSPISDIYVGSMMSNLSLLGLCHSSDLVWPQALKLEQPRVSPARLTPRPTTNQARTWGWPKGEARDCWSLPFSLSLWSSYNFFYFYSQNIWHFLSISKQHRPNLEGNAADIITKIRKKILITFKTKTEKICANWICSSVN